MTSNVAVIIRSVGERTEALCRHLVEQQVPPEHVVVIHERPFSKAVQRSFEIGLDFGLDWTLCVDADVLLRGNGIRMLIEAASTLPESTFTFSGSVLDKLLGHIRPGGGHLYRTQHVQKALEFIGDSDSQIRPEKYVKARMNDVGYAYVVNKQLTVGVHDFEQYYTDIYRKCFVHAHKHNYISKLPEMWKFLSKFDDDYRIALKGWKAGIEFTGDVRIDIADFPKHIDHILRGQRFVEKDQLQLDEFKIDTAEISMRTLQELETWKTLQQSAYYHLKRQWHKLGTGRFIVWLAMTPIRKLKH
ncbi:MAG: hypothetical protein IAE83_02150 [Anaerolinea sp.]|nr:hypothetical protein [Anaerolinea sp.]